MPHNSWKCWYQDLARLPFGFPLNWRWAAAAPTGPFLGLRHNPVPCKPSPAWGVPAVSCPTCLPFGPLWLHWDILPLPGPLSKTLWALLCFGHSYTPSLGQEPGRARGQSQLLALHQCLHFPSNSDKQDGSAPGSGQSPSLCWDQGAEAAGQGRGWKVLVRGHQIQAELETKLISCGRAKLQACWRKLPVRVPALGLAAAAVWLGPHADGEGVWEAGLAQHHGTGHQAQLPQRTPTGGLAGCTPASPCWDRPRVRLCTVSAGSHWVPPCSSGTHARAEGSRWMLPFKAALG